MSKEPCVSCNEVYVKPQRQDISSKNFDIFEKMRWKAFDDGIHMCKDCFVALCDEGVKAAVEWSDKWR